MTAAAADVGRRAAVATGAVAAGALGGAVLALAQQRLGSTAALAVLGLAAAALLFSRWTLAITALLAVVVFAEADSSSMFGAVTSSAYRSIGGFPISPVVLLVLLAAAATALHLRRDGLRAAVPSGLVGPLLLLAGAIVPASMTGIAAGANTFLVLAELVGLGCLLVVPCIVAAVTRKHVGVRGVLGVVVAAASFKAVEGLASWLLGAGRPLGDTTITFYEPTPLWLLSLLVTGVLAATLTRARLPVWVHAGAALAMVCLALSLRRGFWVATVLGIVLVALVASGRRGRALLVPAALVVFVAVTVVVRAGGATDSRNVAVERARSVSPSRIAADDEDRYRLEEQANVRREIADRPITGLGLAVPWRARVPLSLEHEGGRLYTHFVVLWWWLKLGIAGLIAYVWLLVASIRLAATTWRNHPDALVRAAGLAVAVGLLGIAVVEATASFTGVSPRFTILIASVLGWLSVAKEEAGVPSRTVQR